MTMTAQSKNIEQYSYSKLDTFRQCKYQYYLKYIEKNRETESNAFAEYGTMCHKILEKYAKGELEVYELLDEFDKGFKEIQHPFPYNKYTNLSDSYYEGGYTFFQNWDGLDEYKILGSEDEFIINEKDFNFKGYIDLILQDKDGRIILHDWKSKSKFKSKAEKREKSRQLYLYSRRIKERFGVFPDVLQFGMFRVDKTERFKFDLDEYKRAVDWMYSTVDEIRNCNDWGSTPNYFFCDNLCDYRDICEMK